MISVSLTTDRDVDMIQLKPEVYPNPVDTKESFARAVGKNLVYTFRSEDGIGAIIAAIEIYPNVVELYALTSHEMENKPLQYHRAIRSMLKLLVEAMKLVRAQTFVRADYDKGVKFMRTLGFEPEGRLRCYGIDRKNYYIMGRVF
jgi:hypothetical protein